MDLCREKRVPLKEEGDGGEAIADWSQLVKFPGIGEAHRGDFFVYGESVFLCHFRLSLIPLFFFACDDCIKNCPLFFFAGKRNEGLVAPPSSSFFVFVQSGSTVKTE